MDTNLSVATQFSYRTLADLQCDMGSHVAIKYRSCKSSKRFIVAMPVAGVESPVMPVNIGAHV